MSNKKLDALKALFKKEKEKQSGEGTKRSRGDFWPFWEMNVGEKAKVRLLPDKNEENPFQFYVEKLEHKLAIDGKTETIPCLEMYGEKCPISDLSRKFYKEEGKGSANGKYYYRKKSNIVRLLVLEDPLPPDEETGETAVGKVVTTQLGYQLMEKIKEEISSDDLDELPWDIEKGYDFIIKKTAQGEHGTYAVGSGFARRPSAIPEEYLDAVQEGLIDLETLLPSNPGYEFVKRKLDAHLNGSDDSDADEGVSDVKTSTSNSKASNDKVDDDDTNDALTNDSSDDDDDDILAQIRRNRRK